MGYCCWKAQKSETNFEFPLNAGAVVCWVEILLLPSSTAPGSNFNFKTTWASMWGQSINQSDFYSAKIPGKARLSVVTTKLVSNGKILKALQDSNRLSGDLIIEVLRSYWLMTENGKTYLLMSLLQCFAWCLFQHLWLLKWSTAVKMRYQAGHPTSGVWAVWSSRWLLARYLQSTTLDRSYFASRLCHNMYSTGCILQWNFSINTLPQDLDKQWFDGLMCSNTSD